MEKSALHTDMVTLSIIPAFMGKMGLTEISRVEGNDQFQILGDLSQIVHIPLAPGAQTQCEPGTMVYMSDGCKNSVKLGGIGRLLTEGDLFKEITENKSSAPGYVGYTANFPATIIPINLDSHGGAIKCKRDGFLAAIDHEAKVQVSSLNAASCSAACLSCCCAGTPLYVQEVKARGWVFLSAYGSIMNKVLADGEELVVDTNSLVAMDTTVTVDVKRTGGFGTICCGGDGVFNTALRGPGLVVLSSMPLEKLRNLFYRPPPPRKKRPADKTT